MPDNPVANAAARVKAMFLGISNEIARRVRATHGTPQQWLDEAFVERVVRDHAQAVLGDFLAGKLGVETPKDDRPGRQH